MNRKGKKIQHVLFWLESNSGTNEKAIFEIPDNWDKKDIKSALENWCSRFNQTTYDVVWPRF